jgi:hypothetical protein
MNPLLSIILVAYRSRAEIGPCLASLPRELAEGTIEVIVVDHAAGDVGGHREFLRHDHNARLHRPGDVAALRENLLRLLTDESLRLRLVRQALADMAGLLFEPAADRLRRVLLENDRP